MSKRRWLCFAVAAGLAATGMADKVKCAATRDVWLSACPTEVDFNMGAAPRIKLKAWQEFGLVDFEVSALKGRTITEAWLYVKPAGGHKFGLNGGTDLRWLTLSTVSHDWVEGKSASYANDTAGNGATFNESSYQKANWGWPGAKCWDVILGNGNTLRFDDQLAPAEAGWLRIKVDPRLVQALVAGATHGFLLMDGSVSYVANCFIASRESGAGPYLEVTTGETRTATPAAPANVQVKPASNWATADLGAVMVSLTPPKAAFAYHVRVNGQDAQRWQIPFAVSGAEQSFPLQDLPAGAEVKVEIAALDAAGNKSAYVRAAGRASPALTVPTLPAFPFKPAGGTPMSFGEAKVWAFPEITKVSPTTGLVLSEKGESDFRGKNPVWDAANGTIRLAAARGEIVSFQVAVEGPAQGCGIEVSDLKGASGQISAKGVQFWRNWYVGEQAEYAIPLAGKFDCPSADNKIAGQKIQAVTVDRHIPKDAKAGDYQGEVKVSSVAGEVKLALRVRVYDVAIPDEIHFNPELNCYGGPGTAGSDQFRNSFKLAHYHRCTINRVPYNQSGRVHGDWNPAVDDKGHVSDWSQFDANLGGLLDGSWFKDNPRSGVPVPCLYLPLHEGWPRNFRNHYRPGENVPLNGKDPNEKLKHDVLAKPIEEAMDQAFQEAWVTCAKDFYRHAEEKGWNRTAFEFYLNNKPNYGYTLWTLDEPVVYTDWAALNFFGRLAKQGINDPEVYTPRFFQDYFEKGLSGMNRSRPTFLFRGDISRIMWQGSCSDGIMNVVYANGEALAMPRLIRNDKLRMPAVIYVYGGCNKPSLANWESAAWCLKAYASGMDGVLPWQSLGGPNCLKQLNEEGLIIHAGQYGDAVASFRVHALRRGAQDCELLRLLQLKNGWSRGHIGLLVSQKVPLTAQFKQKFSDEAAAVTFGSLTSQGFCEMKEGVLQLLTAR